MHTYNLKAKTVQKLKIDCFSPKFIQNYKPIRIG